jgi:flagellar P-ring protein precursor FlgI
MKLIISRPRILKQALFSLLLLSFSSPKAEFLKDLIEVEGVRQNQVMGYGLVVGLDGTGDQTNYTSITNQTIINMLQQMGVKLPQLNNNSNNVNGLGNGTLNNSYLRSKNVAAVMVTGNLKPFAQPGQVFDVTVASVGSARSLKGGTLLMTPLKGADGEIYAMAQGTLASSKPQIAGTGRTRNPENTAFIVPNGATVEQEVVSEIASRDTILLELKNSDFTVAGRVAESINMRYGFSTAQAQNSRTIQVKAPMAPNERVAFLASLESLEVPLDSVTPKVVLNEKTGSIVINQSVTIDACAVTYGNISLVVSASPAVVESIPPANGKLKILQAGVELIDVVKALNQIGATPQDLLVILQSMKAAGALHAEVEVI